MSGLINDVNGTAVINNIDGNGNGNDPDSGAPLGHGTYAAVAASSENEIGLYPTPSDDTKARINRAMERNNYRDFSHVQKYEVTREASLLKKQQSFPMKLHEILACKEYNDVITWLPHGRAWKVLKDDVLVDQVLGRFFNHKSRASFLRQVNNWNFKRVLTGPDEGAYYNEKFLRGLPHVSFLMKQSQAQKGKSKSKDKSDTVAETKDNNGKRKPSDHPIFARMLDVPPDFYAISQAHPLPEACALSNSFTATGETTEPPVLPAPSAAAVVSAESSSDSSYFPGRVSKKTAKTEEAEKATTSIDDLGVRGGNNTQVNNGVSTLPNVNAGVASVINADGSGNILPSAGVLFGGYVPMQQQLMGFPPMAPPVATSTQPQDQQQQQAWASMNAFANPFMAQTISNPTPQPPAAAPMTPAAAMPYIDPTAMAFLQRMLMHSNNPLAPVPMQQPQLQPAQQQANAPLAPAFNFAWQPQNLPLMNADGTFQQQPLQPQQQPQQQPAPAPQGGVDPSNPFGSPHHQVQL